MKWHLRLLPIYGSAFLLAASFTLAQPDKKGNEPNYYPLQVGNEWKYRVEVGGSSAQAVSRITKMESFEGKDPLARLEAKVNENIVATEHLSVTDQGIFRYRNNGQEITPPIKLLKYPARSGDKWEGDISVGKEKGKYFCETKEDSVEVAAGKFAKAMKVTVTLESKMQKVITSYWFVKDIGFVKQTVEAGDLYINMELEKFEPAKDAPK